MICRLQTHAGTPRQKAFCKLATSENMAVNQMFLSKRTHISHELENRPSQCNAENMKAASNFWSSKRFRELSSQCNAENGRPVAQQPRRRALRVASRDRHTAHKRDRCNSSSGMSCWREEVCAQFHMDGSKVQIAWIFEENSEQKNLYDTVCSKQMLKLEDAFDTIRFMFGDASSISFHKKIKKTNYYIKTRRASYSFHWPLP